MEYRNFGRTGVKVSKLCLGCMNFGGPTEEKEAIEIINAAIDSGVNFADTANVYNNGQSEQIVGKALKNNGKRHSIVLATKVHGSMDKDDPNASGNSRRHIIQQCEASLKRIQTDYIDIYQIHRPQSEVPIDETLRALDDLVRAGKILYIGTSTFAAWQVVDAQWMSERYSLNRFVSEQSPYNILDRRIERELIPAAQNYGLAIISWSPLAGGFLTGKYSRDKMPDDARYKARENLWSFHGYTSKVFDVIDGIRELIKDKNCTMSQFAIAWCANQSGITSPIIGPRTIEQLKDNLASCNIEINDEDRQKIDDLVPPGSAVTNYYKADFSSYKYR